jgi:hypothetical protein
MNIFKFRDQLIDEYRSYVTSFIRIADPTTNSFAKSRLSGGDLWLELPLQPNPTSLQGGTARRARGQGHGSFRLRQDLSERRAPHMYSLGLDA